MKLVDSSVWIAQHIRTHVLHGAATRFLAEPVADGELLICRATQQSLLRLLTTAALFKQHGRQPLTNQEAWQLYDQIASDRRVAWAAEPAGLEVHWRTFSSRATASPKLWMDAYLAAFALAGGHELVTTDQGFRQFAGVSVRVLT